LTLANTELVGRELVSTQAGLQRAACLLLDPGAKRLGDDVELAADCGMGELLFGNKLDSFR